MKLRKLASILLAAVFIFSTAAVAMAQDRPQSDEEDTRRSFVGTISEIEDDTFQLEMEADGETSTEPITMTGDTKVKVSGEPAEDMTGLPGEYIGHEAVVLAKKAGDGDYQAIHVVIKLETPTVQPNVGTVVGVEDGEITIQLPNGEDKTIQLPEDAQVPEVGDVVTAFTGEQEDENVPPMARGLVKAEEIQQRIQKHLEQVSSGEVPGLTRERVQERVQELGNIMETHMNRHVEVLDEVLSHVPEQARDAIRKARDKAEQGRKRALEAIRNAQERAGAPPEDAGKPDEIGPGQPGGPGGNQTSEDKGPPGETGQFGKGGHATNGTPSGPPVSTGEISERGNLRLLISDEANAIGNFTSLNVTISKIGALRGGESGNWTEVTPHTPEVDLTDVQGSNAIEIWSGNFTAGNYTKVFIHLSDVEGILTEDLGGGEADVKLPSDKLQISKPFIITEDETTCFVYDVTVVKAGQSGQYILKPQSDQSGVDKEINEVKPEQEHDKSETEEFEGTILVIDGTTWTVEIKGDERTVNVSEAEVEGEPAEGVHVKIEGVEDNGVILAEEVEVEEKEEVEIG